MPHFFAGLGPSGTFVLKVSRLRRENPNTTSVSLQADDPVRGPEGRSPMEFTIVPGGYDPSVADRQMLGYTDGAYDLARRPARQEGILVSHSTGLALWGLAELHREWPARGERSGGLPGRRCTLYE